MLIVNDKCLMLNVNDKKKKIQIHYNNTPKCTHRKVELF